MRGRNSIVWLDLRSEDLESARRFIKAIEGEGVLDELGFLSLQGRFADVFYPATSVLMSAPRYLYFVAGIYRQLEKEWKPGLRVEREARQRMDRLRAVLAEHEKKGVIGKEAKGKVKQWPSAVYWASLKHLGMLCHPLSERAYQERAFVGRPKGYEDDDGVGQSDERILFWDPDLPPSEFLEAEGLVKEDTSFRLSPSEAKDLFERYKAHFDNSLLVYLVEKRCGSPAFPWETPLPPAFLKAHLEQARCLSLLARGATLQYYSLLLEERARHGLENGEFDLEAHAVAWWATAKRALKEWAPREGLCGLPTTGLQIQLHNERDVLFIERWQESVARANTVGALLSDPEARDLVRRREQSVKQVKSRFRSLTLLKRWRVERRQPGVFQFEYRHGVGRRFAEDMQRALARA